MNAMTNERQPMPPPRQRDVLAGVAGRDVLAGVAGAVIAAAAAGTGIVPALALGAVTGGLVALLESTKKKKAAAETSGESG